MDRTKILVVFTGGTIGSSVQGEYVSPDREKPFLLMEQYHKRFQNCYENTHWETAVPYTVLSENMTCHTLYALVCFLSQEIKKDYDGIIVTHGTDTLAYTAAALSYCLGADTVPVMLVSSDYVLEDVRANGLYNFHMAVTFIRERAGRGVFVPYMEGWNGRNFTGWIHRGSRILMQPPYSNRIESVGAAYAGFDFCEGTDDGSEKSAGKAEPDVQRGRLSKWEGTIYRNPEYSCGRKQDVCFDIPVNEEISGVLQLLPYTGMSYPALTKDVRAVLHHTYHSGTVCSESAGIVRFARQAKERQIPVFVCGAGAGVSYESKKIYGQLGFYVLPAASPAAMYIKLWLCLINGRDPVRAMTQSVGEDFGEEIWEKK